MRIHKEGSVSILLGALVFLLVNGLFYCWLYTRLPLLSGLVFLVTTLLLILLISFFRVPDRQWTTGQQSVVCPADGKVVVIEEITDHEYFHDRRIQVSIFMSPLNVHQNRNPVSGEVVYSHYFPGQYLVAWNPKSSTENERHSVVIRTRNKEILVKQIAGALARRIINYLKVGQSVQQSQEFGFIKLGSRVDVLLPLGTTIKVKLGQKVQGGVTVLAEWAS